MKMSRKGWRLESGAEVGNQKLESTILQVIPTKKIVEAKTG